MVKKIFAYSYVYLIMLLLYAPIFVLIVFSFTAGTNLGDFSQGFSFDLYEELFKDTELLNALGNTLILAFLSAIISTVLGTCGAIGAYYSKRRSRNVLENLNQIPVVNAEIVMALSLTVMFVFIGSVIFKESIFSFFTLLMGHCVLCVPFVYLNVKPKLVQMDPSMYEAALDLGATPTRALTKVVVPQIIPGIASGFLLSITLSLDDFIVTAFLRGPGLLNGEGQFLAVFEDFPCGNTRSLALLQGDLSVNKNIFHTGGHPAGIHKGAVFFQVFRMEDGDVCIVARLQETFSL